MVAPGDLVRLDRHIHTRFTEPVTLRVTGVSGSTLPNWVYLRGRRPTAEGPGEWCEYFVCRDGVTRLAR